MPFRAWLRTLDAEQDDACVEASINEWHKTARNTAIALARNMARSAGESAFIGRSITQKGKGREDTRHYSTSEAFNWFLYNVRKIYEIMPEGG